MRRHSPPSCRRARSSTRARSKPIAAASRWPRAGCRSIEGKSIVLRWRPGIVNIGGDPRVAFSRGPYILQTAKDGHIAVSVGFYQTVWVRDADNTWRVLFDGGASNLIRMDDRAAAVTWVKAQAMSDCAGAP